MVVYVRAHPKIKYLIIDYPIKGALVVNLLEQTTLVELLKKLNLSTLQVPSVAINGTYFYKDTVLKPGDLVELFPHCNLRWLKIAN